VFNENDEFLKSWTNIYLTGHQEEHTPKEIALILNNFESLKVNLKKNCVMSQGVVKISKKQS